MGKFNNRKQVEKANILAEQRYLQSKGLLNEEAMPINDKVAKMIQMSKIDDYSLQLKTFQQSFGIDDALNTIAHLKGLLDQQTSNSLVGEDNGYTVDSETGQVSGGPEDKDNKYGMMLSKYGENTWAYEGYGSEIFDLINNGKPLSPNGLESGDISMENHSSLNNALQQVYGNLPKEALSTDMGFRITDENGVVKIYIELWNGPRKTFICKNGVCQIK